MVHMLMLRRAYNTTGAKPRNIGALVPIDSEQILPTTTNAIVEAVEIGGASALHSADIGVAATCKSAEGDESSEAPNFRIEETIGGPRTTSVGA